jgi:hypothetical protein
MHLLRRAIALFGILLMMALPGFFSPLVLSRAAEGQSGPGVATTVSPHGDLVFRATGTKLCSDCHGSGTTKGTKLSVLDNEAVRSLKAKGKGAHGPGRFADCFRCHAGGRLEVEKY